MPSLASHLRVRLSELLSVGGFTQSALARALGRDRAKVSRILKTDDEAAIVTVGQLDQMAQFFSTSPVNLFVRRGDALMALTDDEVDLVQIYRQLPTEQRQNILGFLRYTMEPRRRASAERREIAKLRATLQREIDSAHSKR